MNTNRDDHDPLLDAIDALTQERTIHTTITDDDTGGWLGVHTEKHASLLVLLAEGTGIGRGEKTSNIRLPIDADALEIWTQIRELTRLWCKQLHATFHNDDLANSLRNWYLAYANAHRAGKVNSGTDEDVTRMVQGWVRMIEAKFDPPEKREWVEPCPAYLPVLDIDGWEVGSRRCGARRIVEKGEERFAIQLNVTTMTAECGRCRTKWVGPRAVRMLRYETNLWNLERAAEEAERDAELTRLANGNIRDTPEIKSA